MAEVRIDQVIKVPGIYQGQHYAYERIVVWAPGKYCRYCDSRKGLTLSNHNLEENNHFTRTDEKLEYYLKMMRISAADWLGGLGELPPIGLTAHIDSNLLLLLERKP